VRAGGVVAILMPAAAASRRSGRRIRGNLLRAGTLRAVVTLSSGGPDLWLLRRPKSGERASAVVLLADVGDDLSLVEPAWEAYLAGSEPPGPSRAVRIIDVLDDEVDLSPARHLSSRGDARDFPAARDRLTKAAAGLAGVPELDVLSEGWADLPVTTIGDLVKAGLVDIRHSALKETDAGDLPVLTVDDLASGGLPSGWTFADHGLVTVSAGDIVASPMTARVVEAGGAVLGPHLSLYRVDRDRVDADFLAGFLRLATSSGSGSRVHLGSSRVDARRARIPRLPLAEQQVYGRAFRELAALEDALRETAAAGGALVRLGLEGLGDGRLRPQP
jgi:hypothetical protein